MKHLCVVFTQNNARIIKSEDLKDVQGYQNVVVNADLAYVKGIPPHFWKLENGFILPMNEEERKARMEAIIKDGTDNNLQARRLAQLEKDRQDEERQRYEKQKREEQEWQEQVDREKEALQNHKVTVLESLALLRRDFNGELARVDDLTKVSNEFRSSILARLMYIEKYHRVINGLLVGAWILLLIRLLR